MNKNEIFNKKKLLTQNLYYINFFSIEIQRNKQSHNLNHYHKKSVSSYQNPYHIIKHLISTAHYKMMVQDG